VGVRGAGSRRPPLPDPPPGPDRPLQHSLPGGPAEVEAEVGEDPIDALHRELLEGFGLDLAVVLAPRVLRFVQDRETGRPGGRAGPRRSGVGTLSALPTCPVTWSALPACPAAWWRSSPQWSRTPRSNRTARAGPGAGGVADAAGFHLYPDVGVAPGRAVRPGTATDGPLLLRA